MDRETRQQYRQILAIAQELVYLESVRFSVHSRLREGQRAIARADAEASILSHDAQIIGHNQHHPEGPTYTILGRRADGEEIAVVIAMDNDNVNQADEITIVTVMNRYQERSAR